MDLLALAIGPGIAICLFFVYRDVFNKEPKIGLVITFVLGALSIYPAMFIEKQIINQSDFSIQTIVIMAFIKVALVEELCKFAVVRGFSYNLKSFDEPLDGIVYSLMASMGFASLENVYYVFDFYKDYGTDQYQMVLTRMFTAVPAHATFGILMGYYVGKAKMDKAKSGMYLVKGLLWAIFFHGLYDLFIFLQYSPQLSEWTANGLLLAGAMASMIVGMIFCLRHYRTHRLLSQQMFVPLSGFSIRRAGPGDIPLIRSLTHQIWPHTYGSILKQEQLDYMLGLMYSEKALEDQMKENHEFVIAYSGKEAAGFASVGMIAPGTFKLHKIYILPSQQGKGMGKYIVETVIGNMKVKGATALQLNVNRHNDARSFYEKLGFAVIREEDIDIGNGYYMNDYVMEKKV